MPDESHLHAKAREAVGCGRLPRKAADRTWGGYGVDEPCAVCELKISTEQLEIELHFFTVAPDLATFHVHVRCFAAWEFERTKPAQ